MSENTDLTREQEDELIEKYASEELSSNDKIIFDKLYHGDEGFQAAAEEKLEFYKGIETSIVRIRKNETILIIVLSVILIGMICSLFHKEKEVTVLEISPAETWYIIDFDTTVVRTFSEKKISHTKYAEALDIPEDSLLSLTYGGSFWNDRNPFNTEISREYVNNFDNRQAREESKFFKIDQKGILQRLQMELEIRTDSSRVLHWLEFTYLEGLFYVRNEGYDSGLDFFEEVREGMQKKDIETDLIDEAILFTKILSEK